MRPAILLILLVAFGTAAASARQNQSYSTPGNLKPTHHLGCLSMDQVKNEYTPPDLMIAFTKCIEADRYDDAMALFNVAGTYSAFDARCVADETAHDAFQALMADYPVDDAKQPTMFELFNKWQAPNSPEMAKFCTDLKRLGPPSYYPGYMIAHGMGAIFGAGGGLVKDFDAKKAWKDSLDKYMHCDVSDL